MPVQEKACLHETQKVSRLSPVTSRFVNYVYSQEAAAIHSAVHIFKCPVTGQCTSSVNFPYIGVKSSSETASSSQLRQLSQRADSTRQLRDSLSAISLRQSLLSYADRLYLWCRLVAMACSKAELRGTVSKPRVGLAKGQGRMVSKGATAGRQEEEERQVAAATATDPTKVWKCSPNTHHVM